MMPDPKTLAPNFTLNSAETIRGLVIEFRAAGVRLAGG